MSEVVICGKFYHPYGKKSRKKFLTKTGWLIYYTSVAGNAADKPDRCSCK
jgi:hypothetical protein